MTLLSHTLKLRQYRFTLLGFMHIVNVSELEYSMPIRSYIDDGNILINEGETKSIILN